MCKLEDIKRLCGGTTGGVGTDVQIVCMDDLDQVPSLICKTTIDQDILIDGDPNSIIVDRQSAIYTESAKTGEECGDYYEYDLRFTKRKNESNVGALISLLKRLKNRYYLLSFIDKTGCRRVLFGAKARPGYSTGRLSSDGNLYTFRFTGKSENPAYILNGSIVNKNTI